jgi:hypothetical protein
MERMLPEEGIPSVPVSDRTDGPLPAEARERTGVGPSDALACRHLPAVRCGGRRRPRRQGSWRFSRRWRSSRSIRRESGAWTACVCGPSGTHARGPEAHRTLVEAACMGARNRDASPPPPRRQPEGPSSLERSEMLSPKSIGRVSSPSDVSMPPRPRPEAPSFRARRKTAACMAVAAPATSVCIASLAVASLLGSEQAIG